MTCKTYKFVAMMVTNFHFFSINMKINKQHPDNSTQNCDFLFVSLISILLYLLVRATNQLMKNGQTCNSNKPFSLLQTHNSMFQNNYSYFSFIAYPIFPCHDYYIRFYVLVHQIFRYFTCFNPKSIATKGWYWPERRRCCTKNLTEYSRIFIILTVLMTSLILLNIYYN